MFVLLLLFFKCRFSRLIELLQCICSVSSSLLLLSELLTVDEFQLFTELREYSEAMNYRSLECGQRSSLLTYGPEILVENVELYVHRYKYFLTGMES